MTEWSAKDYARQSTLQQVMAETQLRSLMLAGDERILDVGCGDGKITAEIAGRVSRGSILGVDPSHDMIAFAAKHFAAANYSNLRFAVGDARRLTYSAKFDLVVSFNALHWVPEQDLALRSIRRALNPAGRAILRMVPDGPRRCLEDVIEEVRQRPSWSQYFPGFKQPWIHFTPEAYRALAERCGLRVVKLDIDDHAWDFKTREGFSAFAHATFVEWTKHLPENRWGDFINEVLDLYQFAAADKPEEANTFKFYQMELVLTIDSI